MNPLRFSRIARRIAALAGRPATCVVAVAVVVLWGLSGPLFGYSNTWQLVINTTTTIITFLMVFIIQNTQNRDTEAMQLKLDELIRATQGAHNALLAASAREKLKKGELDTDSPEIKDLK